MKTDLVVAGVITHQNKILLIYHKKLDKWIPPGGHIDENETPDQALKREVKEELNLEIEILNKKNIHAVEDIKEELAVPFHINVHSVGDHDHCCLFYLCKPKNVEDLTINKVELKNYQWFSREELNEKNVPKDVKNIGFEAFKLLES